MAKKLVERRICDIDGCDKELAMGMLVCPCCGKDYCWQHHATISTPGRDMLMCQPCLLKAIPDFEKQARRDWGSIWPSTGIAASSTSQLPPALHKKSF